MESYLQSQNLINGLKKSYFLRLVVAGVVATLAFNFVMYSDIAITGIPLDIPTGVGQIAVGDEPFAEAIGHVIHIANGIGLALLFGYVVVPIAKRIVSFPILVYAVIFAVIETVVGVWFFMLPALGAGVAGLNISPDVPLITLTRHIVFGVILGIFATRRASR